MMAAHASVTMPSMNHEDSSTGFGVEQESNILDSSIQLCKGSGSIVEVTRNARKSVERRELLGT